MSWIKRSDQEPPKDSIIVGLRCGSCDVEVLQYWESDTRWESSNGGPFVFEYWIPLPPYPWTSIKAV